MDAQTCTPSPLSLHTTRDDMIRSCVIRYTTIQDPIPLFLKNPSAKPRARYLSGINSRRANTTTENLSHSFLDNHGGLRQRYALCLMIYALSVHIIYLSRTSASNADHASRISKTTTCSLCLRKWSIQTESWIRSTVFMPVGTRFIFQSRLLPLTSPLAACKQRFELLYDFTTSTRLKLPFEVSSTPIFLCATP